MIGLRGLGRLGRKQIVHLGADPRIFVTKGR